jgi:hypothetical protein
MTVILLAKLGLLVAICPLVRKGRKDLWSSRNILYTIMTRGGGRYGGPMQLYVTIAQGAATVAGLLPHGTAPYTESTSQLTLQVISPIVYPTATAALSSNSKGQPE